MYAVSTLNKPLLGKQVIESLNLISRVDTVYKDGCKGNYPELFTGLRLMTEQYNETRQYSIIPRCVVLPLMPKVKKELEAWEL